MRLVVWVPLSSAVPASNDQSTAGTPSVDPCTCPDCADWEGSGHPPKVYSPGDEVAVAGCSCCVAAALAPPVVCCGPVADEDRVTHTIKCPDALIDH